MFKFLLLAIFSTIFIGCSPKPEEPTAASSQVPPPPPRIFTPQDWKKSYRATFEELNLTSAKDGTAEYFACFEKGSDEKCVLFAYGLRDDFRKLYHLTPFSTEFNGKIKDESYVGIYLGSALCKAPSLLVVPSIHQKGDWLFFEKISVLADGEVVLEHSFEYGQVRRNNRGHWIHENGTFIATAENISALEKVIISESVVIRLSGQKGYITISKEKTGEFLKDARIIMEIKRRIDKSLIESGGPDCSIPEAPNSKI